MMYEDWETLGFDADVYSDADDWEENEDLLDAPGLDLDEDEEDAEFDDDVDETHYNPYLGCDDWDL